MDGHVLVTGANGFIATLLCRRLQGAEVPLRAAVRNHSRISASSSSQSKGFEQVVLHDHSTDDEMRQALQRVQVVIHLAAKVHVLAEPSIDSLREFRQVNVVWTERLARAASEQGVRRLVYLSSVKVNGEASRIPFTEEDLPDPQDAYGKSKWEAEQALAKVSAETGLETVVVRSPLVYGPGVRGNFSQLLSTLERAIPLPLARVENQRSLIYSGNLVEALILCGWDTRAAGRTYLVNDGEDLSTPELIRRITKALGLPSRLWPVPLSVLRWLGQILRQEAILDRLLGSLQVDSSRIRRELNWQPTYSVDQGLAETIAWFMSRSDDRVTAG